MLIRFFVCLLCIVESAIYFLQTLGWLEHSHWISSISFDNTVELSFFLCASLPIFANEFECKTKTGRTIIYYVITICFITILATKSRTALLFFISHLYFSYFKKNNKLSFLLLLICAGLLLFIKKDSTTGRFFIISQTLTMIAQRPLFGWGHNGFQAHYMNVQADYFSKNHDSSFAILADNIHHPLNEFLFVAVNYGIFALIFVLASCLAIYKYYKSHKTKESYQGMAILSSIMMFSLFSYPHQFYVTWVFVFYALLLVFKETLHQRRLLKTSLFIIIPLFSLIIFHQNPKRLYAYKEWNGIAKTSVISDKIISKYRMLNKDLCEDPYFLYNYAYVLYENGKNEDAMKKAKECQKRLADYDLSLLIGDIYEALADDNNALKNYTLAHHMCPNRFAPLCAIYDVYKRLGNREKCIHLVKTILNKNIKIKSDETMEYVDYIKSEQQKYHYPI